MLLLWSALLAAAPAHAGDAPERIFACSFGAKRVEVIREGARLTYRFGRAGRPEMVLTGDKSGGTVFYHRQLFPHGEDQHLRFRNGEYDYVIYNIWQTPDYAGRGAVDSSGLLIRRGGRIIARMKCRDGGDFLEHSLFFQLPADSENLAAESGD